MISRVRLRNYKSIAACDIELGAFNVFVGRNGSGKSNFLDSLSFLSQCMEPASIGLALERREGMGAVLRKGCPAGEGFVIWVNLELPTLSAEYSIEVKPIDNNWFTISSEYLSLKSGEVSRPLDYECHDGLVTKSSEELFRGRKLSQGHLLLPLAASAPDVRQVFEAISAISVLNPITQLMRRPSVIDRGVFLRPNGLNLAAVIGHIRQHSPIAYQRIMDYLRCLSPGVVDVERVEIQGYEATRFSIRDSDTNHEFQLNAANVSDGTLRALAVLVAVLQHHKERNSSRVICIEEPETAVHPAAMAVILDALREASVNTQILITTHSPDLLDRVDINTDSLFAVSDESGSTVIAPIDNASASVIRDRLYTPGELLRSNQLEPRIDYPAEQSVTE